MSNFKRFKSFIFKNAAGPPDAVPVDAIIEPIYGDRARCSAGMCVCVCMFGNRKRFVNRRHRVYIYFSANIPPPCEQVDAIYGLDTKSADNEALVKNPG